MTNAVAVTVGKTMVVGEKLARRVIDNNSVVDNATDWLIDKGMDFAVDAAISVAMLLVGWVLIKLLTKAITKAIVKRGNSRSLLARFVCSMVTKACWAILVVMILGQLGVDVGPLIAGLGVTGFIIGFAFQETLGNFASGMMIALNEPFTVGQRVKAAGLEGTVRDVNTMATVLTTDDNKRVVVPNKSVWGSPIINFSAMDERRADFNIGIAYGTDIAKARSVAMATLKTLEGALQVPPPLVEVDSLDDSQVTLVIRVWARNADYSKVRFAAMQKIKEAFDSNGIPIPFPQLCVHQV